MKLKSILLHGLIFFPVIAGSLIYANHFQPNEPFVSYIADPKKQEINLYWKNEQGHNFGSIGNLKRWLAKKNKTLIFATNGGMYKPDRTPQGLYIEKQKTLSSLDSSNNSGNFYLKPNGVFYLTTENLAFVCKTENFYNNGSIKFATQSGPMLVVDGQIHPAFKKGSSNLNIRNGVGILPNNKVVFAMSKKELSFYDFANYFKSMGCKNALYLDGLVSRTYLPAKKWTETDGDFGVIIGITSNAK